MDDRGRHSGLAVTIPRSLESGVFPFFFSKSFLIATSMAIPRSHRPGVFLIPFLTYDVSDHTTDPSLIPGYGH